MKQYFTVPISALVNETVCSYWQVERSDKLQLRETIIPKGMVELIFSYQTAPLFVNINHQRKLIHRCFIQGFQTLPIELEVADTHTFFGVVLNTSSIKHFFNLNPAELSNCQVDLTLIAPIFNELWYKIGEQSEFKKRVAIFSEMIERKASQIALREKAFDLYLKTFTDTHLTVTELANKFCLSTKQLSRKLYELTAMNTEQVLLYKKYLQAVHLIHNTALSLTEIGYKCNFYDQSHFIKTFRHFSLLTPNEYRHRKGRIEGHIIENVY